MMRKTFTLGLGATAFIAVATVATNAAIFTWVGGTSPTGDLNVDGNWQGGTQPAGIGNDQPSTPAISDSLVFDSNIWNNAPRTLYTRNSRKWGSIVVNNGTVTWQNDANNQGNSSWGGTTTLVVGDGDTTAAEAAFNVVNWNQGGTDGTKTYVINSDGTLSSARGGTHTWSNGASYDTVMEINGGAVDITGELVESQLVGDAGDYVSFNEIDSTFTFAKGSSAGQFQTATDVTNAYGTAFVVGGSISSFGTLELTDNGSTWTITAVPEPASLMLLGAGSLFVMMRRRG